MAGSKEVEDFFGPSIPGPAREKLKLDKREQDRQQMLMDLEQVRTARRQDMEEGRNRGEQLFGQGKLGRVEQGRAAEIADIIARRKAALSGFSNEESNAMREKSVGVVNQNTQGSLRSLKAAQGASGVRGGMASAQAARVVSDADRQKAELERDLFLKGEEVKRGALDNLESSTTGARSEELGREKYNIEQGGKEKYGQLASEFGYGQLGAAERNGVMQKIIGENQAESMVEAAEKQGKK